MGLIGLFVGFGFVLMALGFRLGLFAGDLDLTADSQQPHTTTA